MLAVNLHAGLHINVDEGLEDDQIDTDEEGEVTDDSSEVIIAMESYSESIEYEKERKLAHYDLSQIKISLGLPLLTFKD